MKRSWLVLVLLLSGLLALSLAAACSGGDDDDDDDDDDNDTTDDDDDDTGGGVCSECAEYQTPCMGAEDAQASCEVFWAAGEMSDCEKLATCHLWACQLDQGLDCEDYDIENPDIQACIDAYQDEVDGCD